MFNEKNQPKKFSIFFLNEKYIFSKRKLKKILYAFFPKKNKFSNVTKNIIFREKKKRKGPASSHFRRPCSSQRRETNIGIWGYLGVQKIKKTIQKMMFLGGKTRRRRAAIFMI